MEYEYISIAGLLSHSDFLCASKFLRPVLLYFFMRLANMRGKFWNESNNDWTSRYTLNLYPVQFLKTFQSFNSSRKIKETSQIFTKYKVVQNKKHQAEPAFYFLCTFTLSLLSTLFQKYNGCCGLHTEFLILNRIYFFIR